MRIVCSTAWFWAGVACAIGSERERALAVWLHLDVLWPPTVQCTLFCGRCRAPDKQGGATGQSWLPLLIFRSMSRSIAWALLGSRVRSFHRTSPSLVVSM